MAKSGPGLSGPNTCTTCGGKGSYQKEVPGKLPFARPRLERVDPCDGCGGKGTIGDDNGNGNGNGNGNSLPKRTPRTVTGWETDIGWQNDD
jgi:DnaJ-class molecular chaperone